jgi:hypothetical protein
MGTKFVKKAIENLRNCPKIVIQFQELNEIGRYNKMS